MRTAATPLPIASMYPTRTYQHALSIAVKLHGRTCTSGHHEPDGISTVIAIFTLLYVPALGLTLWGLIPHKPNKRRLHPRQIPLHIVHGVVSVHLYSDLRKQGGIVGHPPGSANLYVGAGIRGVLGILLPVWYIVASFKSGLAPESFYLIPANILFIGCFVASAVFTGTYLPMSLDGCANLEPEAAQIFSFARRARGSGRDEVDGCRQVFLLQTLTILIIERITLCGSCGALENAEITVARERKETAAYQVAAGG
ncbi:hypothetical protein NEMBOFW57_003773 [Staphylotrichum longicolle]|uniref:Uncharacterized protein n=1 Tax=Staphylotrichum longicolle TaxID=669026 RepID=A0AAD4I3L9_9PEZI|nr:hypothetical protein NEMBOFW57_003773 [Staphylotrichum longicolle]